MTTALSAQLITSEKRIYAPLFLLRHQYTKTGSKTIYVIANNDTLSMNGVSALNICIEGVSSEALMISTKHLCGISNGSACTSKSYSPSYVLTAMGIPTEQIESSIRVSWGHSTDMDEVVENFKNLLNMAEQMKS